MRGGHQIWSTIEENKQEDLKRKVKKKERKCRRAKQKEGNEAKFKKRED